MNWRNGKLRLSGIGTMKARGEARTPGQVVCCDIMHKADGCASKRRIWMPGDLVGHATLSVVADAPELRACAQKSPVRTRASMWLRIRGDAFARVWGRFGQSDQTFN